MPKAAKTYRATRHNTYDQRRGTRTQRGYDNRWLRFSKRYLRENPLCVDCLTKGLSVAATEVHHIQRLSIAPERQYDSSNLMALCKRCHTERTNKGE